MCGDARVCSIIAVHVSPCPRVEFHILHVNSFQLSVHRSLIDTRRDIEHFLHTVVKQWTLCFLVSSRTIPRLPVRL